MTSITRKYLDLKKNFPSAHHKTCISIADSRSKLAESPSITCVGIGAEQNLNGRSRILEWSANLYNPLTEGGAFANNIYLAGPAMTFLGKSNVAYTFIIWINLQN